MDEPLLRFVVPGAQPDTLPLPRLLDYLTEVGRLVGEADALHLVGIEAGSAVAALRIDPTAVTEVRKTLLAAQRGELAGRPRAAWEKLRALARNDNRQELRLELDGLTVAVPPADEALVVRNVRQRSALDGIVVRVGGRGETATVDLLDLDETLHRGLKATRTLAKDLARRLYEPVRVMGEATWRRDEAGWHLESFTLDRFVPLERADAAPLLERLAQLGKDLPEDIIDRVLAGRDPEA